MIANRRTVESVSHQAGQCALCGRAPLFGRDHQEHCILKDTKVENISVHPANTEEMLELSRNDAQFLYLLETIVSSIRQSPLGAEHHPALLTAIELLLSNEVQNDK